MDRLSLVTGKLIYEMDYELLRFEDSSGRVYEYSKLNFLTGRWQAGEGYLSYPGIMIIQGNQVITEGDTIIGLTDRVLFKDTIIILGSLRNLLYANGELLETKASISDFDKTVSLQNNDKRICYFSEDGEGNIIVSVDGKQEYTANLVVRLAGKAKGGHLNFDINGGFTVNLKDKDNKFVSSLTIAGGEDGQTVIAVKDKANNSIQIDENGIEVTDANENKFLLNAEGIKLETPEKGTITGKSISLESDKVKIGDTNQLQEIFNELFAAIQSMTFATGAQGSPTIPTPLNWSTFQNIQIKAQKFLSE